MKTTQTILALFAFFAATAFSTAAQIHDVKGMGAKADGKTLDTVVIQRAIDMCAAAGGGTVYFAPGNYLTGTIEMKSNVTMHLEAGAVLLGSANIADYTPQPVRYQQGLLKQGAGHVLGYKKRHLIMAHNAVNIAIEGRGAIDGQGDSFFDAGMNVRPDVERPSPLIEFYGCTGITVQGITIRKASAWTLHAKNCDDFKVRGVSILNNVRAVNTDGIDIDSTRNVMISDCRIEAGDDCIVLKTTREGDNTKPVENVVVTNCVLVSAASALKLGTESHGDFRHILFSNCVIRDSRTGLALLAKDGGAMEDVRFSNITMTTKPKWGKGFEWPIIVDVEKRSPESRISRVRDVAFSDITVYTKGRIMVSGMPESIVENVSFRNVQVNFGGYEDISKAEKVRGGAGMMNDVVDYGPKPAAFIFAFAKDISIDDVSVRWPASTGAAPARGIVYGDRLDGAYIGTLRGGANTPSGKPVMIENSKNVEIQK